MEDETKAGRYDLVDRIAVGARMIAVISEAEEVDEIDEFAKAHAKAMQAYLRDILDAATELVERVDIRVAVYEGRIEGSLETLADMRPKR